MTRQTAYQILTKHLTNKALLAHSLAVEATMRALAVRLGGDVEEWGITGLLHDADYEKAKGHPDKHGILLFELEPNSIPTTVEQAIKSHNSEFTHVVPQNKMDWALLCSDELTGIIQELVHKQKDKNISSLTSALVIEKLNGTNAFKEVDKKNIFFCEEKLGIPLPEFIQTVLSAMQEVETQKQTSA